ncbi:response regulator [Microtetraspora malaysiensis]|uniref:response regulator n=1 Tax=Microtetraspora malaysiensis TaxID=161358 RepID=UPI003D8FF1A6
MAEPAEQIRVALVDDQMLVRVGLRMMIEAESDLVVVGEAADGHEAMTLARQSAVDVMLMDVRMPEVNGITATAEISRFPDAPAIVVLTTFDLDEYVFAALRAGACGFVLKGAHPRELTSAIRSAHRGDAVLAPRATRALLEAFLKQPEPQTETTSGSAAILTPREKEILTAVAAGLTNSQIAARYFVAESTVKTHIGRLRQKLDARDRLNLVLRGYELGVLNLPRSR